MPKFKFITAMVLKIKAFKIENSGIARSGPFSQILSQFTSGMIPYIGASEMALGITEDLVIIMSNLDLKKLGEPVWKLQKRKTGYSVNIFWRNSTPELSGTLINAYHSQGRRKERNHR